MSIVLLTDFGLKDPYVGILKGVIAQIAPQTSVIDLTHEISSFDIVQAGFALHQAYRYFPKGSIFVAVVDPGVGSARQVLLVQTKDYFFLAPDNGLLTLVLAHEKPIKVIRLENRKYFLKECSQTFHGRDIFAPVAAHLSKGIAPQQFGKLISNYQKLDDFSPQVQKNKIIGQIIHIDHFGNAITNLSQDFLKKYFPNLKFQIVVKKKKFSSVKKYYAQNKAGEITLLFGSAGFLEIAVNQGSAAKKMKLKNGDAIEILSI